MGTLTAKDLLAKKKPVTRTVQIVLDGELADEWAKAQSVLDAAHEADAKASTNETRLAVAEAEATLDELRPAIEDATVELKLQSLGRRAYQALLELHPPTKEQKAKAQKVGNSSLDHNVETFPPALISASLVEPKMTEEEAAELFASEKFNEVELSELYSAALVVNTMSKVVDLKKDSPTTNG